MTMQKLNSSSAALAGRAAWRLRQWMRKHWFVSALLVLYGVWKVYWLAWGWVLTPTINPHPTDLVTIRGTFPFDKGYTMEVYHKARTSTPWVNWWCGYPMSSKGFPCHGGLHLLTVKQLDSKNYELSFFRDFYLPGIAGWKLSGLAMSAPKVGAPAPVTSSGFPRISTSVKCFESETAAKDLICAELDFDGPDIYTSERRNLEVNFYLKSELPAHLANLRYPPTLKGE